MPLLLDLFLTFFRIGVFTFGGGYAMLPMLQKELVDKKGWVTEEEILERLETAVEQILSEEERLRNQATEAEADQLMDRVRRAEGILRYAHTLTTGEMMEYLSDLRLGAAMGLTNLRVEALTSLFIETMPATLTLGAREAPKQDRERDILRAKMVKETLFGA